MRNVLAHAGKSGRRVASAFIATAFAQDAITRLVGAILMERSEEWAVQRARYMMLETMPSSCYPRCQEHDRPDLSRIIGGQHNLHDNKGSHYEGLP